jgi:drug/metabolite transporter (DMT)-like permease
MSPNTKGALLMMASMAAYTINDALIKATDGALPLFQLLTLRGVMTLVLVLVLAARMRALDFRMTWHDFMLLAVRCLTEIAATYCFITALLHMPLANISAVLQMLPLTVTLGAALFFREAVGWRRSVAIAVGFVGMLLIVRPGADGFNIYSAYALGAVFAVTLRDLVTRRMSPDLPSMTVTVAVSAAILGFGLLGSIGEQWQPVELKNWALLAGSSIFIMGGYQFSVQVMRVGDVSFIAPFRYTGLLWALVLGWLIFGDWPDGLTMLGATIVVGTGLFTLFRERALLRG